MKAISLWQPWATLWVMGFKVHETRHWPTNVRGTIAVHAAKIKTKEGREVLNELPLPDDFPAFDDLPFGCIVGTVKLVECLPVEAVYSVMPQEEILDDDAKILDWWCGNYEPGRFAWRAINPKQLVEPVPYRGAQGFFNVDRGVLTAGTVTTTQESDGA